MYVNESTDNRVNHSFRLQTVRTTATVPRQFPAVIFSFGKYQHARMGDATRAQSNCITRYHQRCKICHNGEGVVQHFADIGEYHPPQNYPRRSLFAILFYL